LTNEYYPVVIEQESNGTFSAWVAGLPGVYAAANTRGEAKRAIRGALVAHLEALKELNRAITPKAEIMVLRYRNGTTLESAGVGALLGRQRSAAKTKAARENGRKGGRPRLNAAHH
jgi:predicted RNase H-like HicB family nuclease